MYGEVFEHFIILQCVQLSSYFYRHYRFSYLQTKDGAEIDLVVERPGLPILFIEIKSSTQVKSADLLGFKKLTDDFGSCEAICLSRDAYAKQYDHIKVIPWQQGIMEYFFKSKYSNSR
jgi:predicted AAA+ superfamily ATPase